MKAPFRLVGASLNTIWATGPAPPPDLPVVVRTPLTVTPVWARRTMSPPAWALASVSDPLPERTPMSRPAVRSPAIVALVVTSIRMSWTAVRPGRVMPPWLCSCALAPAED